MTSFKTTHMLTKLPYYCAAKRHHNGSSTHMKVNYALFTLDAKTNKSKSFIILAVLRQSVLRFYGAHLRVIAPGQHRSIWRNVDAAVASRWQHCVQFDPPKIRTSDLPLERRTRYRSTEWITVQISSCGTADDVASNTSVSHNTGWKSLI